MSAHTRPSLCGLPACLPATIIQLFSIWNIQHEDMTVYLRPTLSNFQKILLLIVVSVARTKPNPDLTLYSVSEGALILCDLSYCLQ